MIPDVTKFPVKPFFRFHFYIGKGTEQVAYSSLQPGLAATGTHVPYWITQCVTCHPSEVTFEPLLMLVLDLATPSEAELTYRKIAVSE